MPTYKVTHKFKGTAEITADRYVSDGSGTRFYDEDGKPVASFADGQIIDVVDASVTFTNDEASK